MTAEERLQELYESSRHEVEHIATGFKWYEYDGVMIRPEHIDLIADLVVERLKELHNKTWDGERWEG